MEVLFCDNHLLAVNKPAGLVTQPSPDHSESLEDQAKAWIKRAYDKPGKVFLEAVHRIDRPVSGVVLFARTSKALSRCQEMIRNQAWKKTYLAVVEGEPAGGEGTLRHSLMHAHRRAEIRKGGKEAILHYRVIRTANNCSLLEIDLKTGRYHQIRAQLAHIGCPIVGDRKYGSRQELPGGAIALHHQRLELAHPVRRTPCRFEAPPPPGGPWPD
jgi:23S rRNA pseudouridine1911/1915/1917 synthase